MGMKYRKRAIVVEAEVYRAGLEDGFVNGVPVIHTLEGDLTVSPTDYVVTGIEGERYPVRASIFRKSFEPVSELERTDTAQ
jgi:hypothetical protein